MTCHPWRPRLIVAILLAAIGCGGREPDPSDAVACAKPEYVPKPTAPWPCPPGSAVRAIQSQLSVVFEEDPTPGELVCRESEGSADLTRLQERVFQALYLIERLEFDAPLPWTSKSLWQWFVSEVRGIRVGGPASLCCDPARVILIGVSPTGKRDPGFPDLIEGLVHEARHADYRHPHSCGESADNTIGELGAYGVQYYLNRWLAEHAVAPWLSPEERRYSANRGELMRYYGFCFECR